MFIRYQVDISLVECISEGGKSDNEKQTAEQFVLLGYRFTFPIP